MDKHKGTELLETPRLLLRRAVPEDAEPMYRNWASDPEVTKYLTWPPHSSPEVSQMVISSWIAGYQGKDFYQWMIVPKEIMEPIGSIGVVDLSEGGEKAEIGYCIGKSWWHRGLMTEALGAVLDYLFDQVGMEVLEARHDVNNPHSGGVMRKCGMKYLAREAGAGRNNQGVCDIDCYALRREERT